MVRILARSALISLLIAFSTLILGGLIGDAHFPLSLIKVGLSFVFQGASTVGAAALLLWVMTSGCHVVLCEREDGSGDFIDRWP